MNFTVNARKLAVTVSNQTKDYGADVDQTNTLWNLKAGSTLAGTETKDGTQFVIYTADAIGTYAPGSTNNGVIKVRFNNQNYVIDEENSTWGNLTVNAATALALDDSKTDNFTKIVAFGGKTVDDVTVKLSDREQAIASTTFKWNAQQFNMMVLPFDVTVSELSAQLGYAIVNIVNSAKTTEGDIYFSLAWGTITANTPFVVRTVDAMPAEGKTLSFTDKQIVASATAYPSADAGKNYKIVGAYETYAIDETSAAKEKFFGNNQDHGISAGSVDTWDIIPFDGYLDYKGAAESREVVLTFEDPSGSTTRINAAVVNTNAANAEGWYNLNGMKLQGAPTEKGVYIKDGKKYVVK